MLFAWSDIFRIYMTEHKLFLELKRESYIVILNTLMIFHDQTTVGILDTEDVLHLY